MSRTDLFNKVFHESVVAYHLTDNVDSPCPNPYEEGSFEALLFRKNWIDVVQWHLEDLIRAEDIEPRAALALKRRIDASNQNRTDLVEQIDDYFFEQFARVKPQPDARINTETPAWAIDRLSILHIKIYHMKEEAERKDAAEAHLQKCAAKLQVLQQQQKDLSLAIDHLLEEMASGQCVARTYKQMKMYNDPELNPVLRKSE